MATHVVKTEPDREAFLKVASSRKLPYTADLRQGAPRTAAQNRLAFQWYREIAEQLGDRETEEVRGECKLTIGVPILRETNEKFREVYDRLLKHLTYEQKIEAMTVLDIPITRLMTTGELTRYLDEMQRRYGEMGVRLTIPEELA